MRKIKIESGGTGASTRVIDVETGEKLAFANSVVVRFDPGKGPIKAMMKLFETVPGEAGKRRRVKVEFGPEGLAGGGKLVTREEECVVVEISMKSRDGG